MRNRERVRARRLAEPFCLRSVGRSGIHHPRNVRRALEDSLYALLWRDGFMAHALLIRWAHEEISVVLGKLLEVCCDIYSFLYLLREVADGLTMSSSKLPEPQIIQLLL
jgi:hypothetical protein